MRFPTAGGLHRGRQLNTDYELLHTHTHANGLMSNPPRDGAAPAQQSPPGLPLAAGSRSRRTVLRQKRRSNVKGERAQATSRSPPVIHEIGGATSRRRLREGDASGAQGLASTGNSQSHTCPNPRGFFLGSLRQGDALPAEAILDVNVALRRSIVVSAFRRVFVPRGTFSCSSAFGCLPFRHK